MATLRAAELLRGHGTHKAMAGGVRVVFLDQLAAHGQRRYLATQPDQHPPDGAVVQRPFVDLRFARRRLIARDRASRMGRLAIRLAIILQVAEGSLKKCGAGVTLIGEYESRDNR